MIEIALVLIIAVLSGLIGWMDWNNRKERKNLLNAILAKDNQELVNLELADKTKLENRVEEPKEELVETADLDDEEFDKFVLGKDNG